MTLKEFGYAHGFSYRTAKRMLQDGRLRRVPGPLLRSFDVERGPMWPRSEMEKTDEANIIIGK
jgi:hypothetical protein